jgi:hypothetical protein
MNSGGALIGTGAGVPRSGQVGVTDLGGDEAGGAGGREIAGVRERDAALATTPRRDDRRRQQRP